MTTLKRYLSVFSISLELVCFLYPGLVEPDLLVDPGQGLFTFRQTTVADLPKKLNMEA
jgi:hypothetical protein